MIRVHRFADDNYNFVVLGIATPFTQSVALNECIATVLLLKPLVGLPYCFNKSYWFQASDLLFQTEGKKYHQPNHQGKYSSVSE